MTTHPRTLSTLLLALLFTLAAGHLQAQDTIPAAPPPSEATAPIPPPPPPPPPPLMHQGKGDVFKIVEHMPRFPGCEDLATKEERKKCADQKMLKFIYQHLQYPPEALENKVEGIAIIQFIVEKDGSIEEMRVVSDPGHGLGEEALRVVGLMAKEHNWIPGPSRGRAVRVQFELPINFRLPEREE